MTAQAEVRFFRSLLKDQLSNLWSNLDEAMRRARVAKLDPYDYRSGMSIEMSSIIERIKDLTTAVGPTPWEEVSVRLLDSGGWYEAIHAQMGVEHEPIDQAAVDRTRARIAQSANYSTRKAS